ncbi:MAG: DNA replication and repair protein RecF [Candidatus Gracilibacteria bacterium]|nr:DNA replication and repair protein RecF [Candidatus Gracilibacteria bacterium]
MLTKVKIINFKSIQNMDLYFDKINDIIGKNGVGKTNILQAICYLFLNNINNSKIEDLIKSGEENIYIEGIYLNNDGLENKLIFSYDLKQNKKQIILNGKKTTKKFLTENILKTSYFSPISMNLFYLGPKYRRDFLDDILKNTFNEYEKLLKNYENILKNRNKVLKNIFEEKSQKEEIVFWDEEFIKYCILIYSYRTKLNEFIKENIKNNCEIFGNKIKDISYKYTTKVDLENIEKSIKEYLEKNFDRDIILGKTHIGPHIDDFDIVIDGKNLVDFASRGEIKSLIINLKLIEIYFIQKITNQLPIVLIDDLASELDEEHSNFLLERLSYLQVIFTSILAINKDYIKVIYI